MPNGFLRQHVTWVFERFRDPRTRGGVAALLRILNNRVPNLAITPDGPRGPRRNMAPGAVYLASRLGIPVVPVGLGYARPWRVRNSWDQFAIPRPYSRARAIFGPRVVVPDGLSRDRLDGYSRRIEAILNRLTETAEQWAGSGCRMAHQRLCAAKASRLTAATWLDSPSRVQPEGVELRKPADPGVRLPDFPQIDHHAADEFRLYRFGHGA